MMQVHRLMKNVEKFTVDNSPAILTAIGMSGTITTAVLTGKASVKASRLIEEQEAFMNSRSREPVLPLDRKEKIKLVWRLYIPAISTGVVTLTAIYGAQHVSARRATAMATAFSISEKAFYDYKEKVIEKIGDKKEEMVRAEVAQDRMNEYSAKDTQVIITDGNDVLFHDSFTGRFFKSTVEKVRSAENDINQMIYVNGYASVSDFFEILDLQTTSYSEEVGWNGDWPLKIRFSTVMSPDDRPCISIDYDLHPNRKYSHFAE